MTKKLLLAAGCCALLFAACKKDDDNNNTNPNPTKKDLLVAGKWQIKALTITGPLMGIPVNEDEYATWDACEKDDFILFNSNGTVEFNVGATKCDTDDSTYHGTFALINNDAQLVLGQQGYSDTMNIAELTAASLKLNVKEDSLTTNITLSNIK